ncbi:MAG: hypothetical protein HYV78_01745 [Candidatus Wildermuthbacteria bacterium]|nr:hypothetical protein [Candidatus Wildermuthbacteria bacterium]
MNENFLPLPTRDSESIDIAVYIKALARHWIFILFFVVLATGSVGVWSFLSLKVYRVAAVLQVGGIGKDLVEQQDQIVNKIKEDVYQTAVRKELGLNKGAYFALKAETPKGTNLVVVFVETADPELAARQIDQTNNLIVQAHKEQIQLKKEAMEGEIEYIRGAIALTEQKQKVLEEKVRTLQNITVFQQDIGSQFALISAKEQLASQKQEIHNLNREMFARQNALSDIYFTQTIKYAVKDKGALRPRPIFNMGIVGMISIATAIFVVSSREWWKKNTSL